MRDPPPRIKAKRNSESDTHLTLCMVMERSAPPVTSSSSLTSNNVITASATLVIPQKRSRAERALRRIYTLQVHGFIEAAEVVDVDPETIEDILDGFDNGVDSDEGSEGDDLPLDLSRDASNDVYDEWANIFPYLKEGKGDNNISACDVSLGERAL